MTSSPLHEILLPLLRHTTDGKDWTFASLRSPIADDFSLTASERAEHLPNITQTRIGNRLCCAKNFPSRLGS